MKLPAFNVSSVVLFCTFFIALILEIVPLSRDLSFYRPEWLVMVVLFWVITLPERIGVFSAWLAGLFLDVIAGDMLGQSALALMITAFLAYRVHTRIRAFSVWQQCFPIILLVGLYLLIVLLMQRLTGVPPWSLTYWLPALISGLAWPFVKTILSFLQRIYEIY